MKLTINKAKYSFSFRGFGPQYTYEVITGEPFQYGSTRNAHILMFATLLSCNPDTFSMKIEAFTEWLYEHPTEERDMMQEIVAESQRRAALYEPKKKDKEG